MNIQVPNNIHLSSSSLPTIGLLILGFIVISVLAHMSRGFLSWSLSGASIGFFFGIFTVLALGFAIYYFAKPTVKTVLGMVDKPTVVKQEVAQKDTNTNVLGAETNKVTYQSVNSDFDNLKESRDRDEVRKHICTPF